MKKILHKGMTLIELVITILVLGVGLSGIMAVIIMTSSNSVSPQIRWQSIILGESVLKILMSKPYEGSFSQIQNEKIENVFPELAKELKYSPSFRISIEMQPYASNQKAVESVLVNVNIHHDTLGDTRFGLIKTKD